MALKNKVVIVGWDAADWKIIYPLLAEGKLPALKKLIDNGVHGNLQTLAPAYSPMLWTSVATGKTANKHGILGFIEINPDKQQVRPVTVSQRKTRALWNILHNQGLKSNLIGWWPSHPSEPINGHVVSDMWGKRFPEEREKWGVEKGSFHPKSLINEMADLRVHVNELTEQHVLPFIPEAHKIDQEKDKSLPNLLKILAQNSTFQACSTYLMENKEWDFTGVYFNMIDHICHGFMRFHPPKLPRVRQEHFDIYKGVVEGAYRFQDMMLERTLDFCDDNTLVIVMSDHGYVSDNDRMLDMPGLRAAPALEHRDFGIFVAAGPGIKKKEKIFGASLLDITPTILNFLDLPIGKDMDGRVLEDVFENPNPIKYIESWDEVEGDFGEHNEKVESDPLSEQQAIEQLIELGYIDRPDENIEKAIKETWIDLQFNLARVKFSNDDIDEAEKILLDLLKEDTDTYPFLLDLINIKIKKKEFVAATDFLEKLKSKKPKGHLKLSLLEADIFMASNRPEQALEILNRIKVNSSLNAPAHFKIGKHFLNVGRYKEAEEAFQKSIEIKPDNAKYQHAIAKALMLQEKYEDAVDHALASIELVRYYPDAHYTLGQILEKLGENESAKLAFETANKLRPQNIKAKKGANVSANGLKNNKSNVGGDFITIVSGLPRSGTSMMMQALHAGGMEALSDGKRKSDENNPKGYFEIDEVKSLHKDNSILDKANNKSLKVVAPLLKFIKPEYNYKVIFMLRDIDEIILSQKKMLGRENKATRMGLKESLQAEVRKAQAWAKHEPGVDILYLNYTDVINQPELDFKKVSDFLNNKVNAKNMTAAVDKSLYRNRK